MNNKKYFFNFLIIQNGGYCCGISIFFVKFYDKKLPRAENIESMIKLLIRKSLEIL